MAVTLHMLFLACAITAVIAQPFPFGKKYSVYYNANSKQWSVKEGDGGIAWAVVKNQLNETGWYILDLVSSMQHEDSLQAYGSGYLEGAITQPQIWDTWRSFANGTTYTLDPLTKDFIVTNDRWIRQNAANPTENKDFWTQVGLVMKQLDGLTDGYNKYAPKDQQLNSLDMLLLQLQAGDLGDIENAVGATLRTGTARHRSLVSDNDVPFVGMHCSSLVKLTKDAQHMFSSQVTWTGYSGMLRTFKNYNNPFRATSTKAAGSTFSGYPGVLVSGDDYYITTSNLVVMETTNGVMNQTLFKYVTTKTVPYWIRVFVANRMAVTGNQWVNVFSLYNSGTYNNQWIVVDNKQFTAGKPLGPGALWIAEQVPGYIVSADKTDFLQQNGYWPSYNIPYFPFIYDISGYPAYFTKYGNSFSYEHCARANIFRRDHSSVTDMDTMKKIMRYNKYQLDPLSLGDACRGISARCDLNTPWVENTLNGMSAFGAIDAKITSASLSKTLQTNAVCGPTWDSQPPFAWTDQWVGQPNFGQPRVFDFDFITIKPLFRE